MPETMAASNCFKYNYALVSRIANSFRDNSSFDLRPGSTIDIDKARQEHELLVDALRRIGVDVIELPCDEKHPDGLFVDDIAVVINGTALICNPPSIKDKPSRQGEVRMSHYVSIALLHSPFIKSEMQFAFIISCVCVLPGSNQSTDSRPPRAMLQSQNKAHIATDGTIRQVSDKVQNPLFRNFSQPPQQIHMLFQEYLLLL